MGEISWISLRTLAPAPGSTRQALGLALDNDKKITASSWHRLSLWCDVCNDCTLCGCAPYPFAVIRSGRFSKARRSPMFSYHFGNIQVSPIKHTKLTSQTTAE